MQIEVSLLMRDLCPLASEPVKREVRATREGSFATGTAARAFRVIFDVPYQGFYGKTLDKEHSVS